MEQNELPVKKITLEFTAPEVNMVLSALSALPTGHGVWPLAMRIKQEAEKQLPPEISAGTS